MNHSFNVDEITEGKEIPSLKKSLTPQQFVMWAGASGDYNPIHYDNVFAHSHGLPGIIAPGQLITAFICQMLSDWYGRKGTLKKLNVSYKGMNFPGDTLTCRGIIKNKTTNNDYIITLDIWVENPKGEKTVAGTAVVEIYKAEND